MKKGFTLIELLAVVVILAIITLIATPIILDVINDTKEESTKISVQNYMDAVELTIAHNHMMDNDVLITGTYEIIENGKYIKSVDNPDQEKLKVEYEGEGLTGGTVKLIDGQIREANEIKINKYYVRIMLGEVKLFNKEIKKVELTTGQNFNTKIKTLVVGTETKPGAVDTTVTSIELLSYGKLPKGYKLEDFQKLERVDISNQGDETIYAIYDGNDKVYIYTEDEIVFNKTSSFMFQKFQSAETIDFGGYINTSKVTNMGSMFNGCSNLVELDVSNWDTSKVTSMGNMFYTCKNLTALDVSNWDTGNVTSMTWMFFSCNKLQELDVSNWKIDKVTNFENAFHGCSSLEELDVSNWNTENVTNMHGIFASCKSLTELDVNNFNTSKVTTMDSMFYGCSGLTSLDVSSFDTDLVTSMQNMFAGCSSLTSLDVSNFDTSNITSMISMFSECSSLTELDLSNFDTGKIESMQSLFKNCENLIKLDISKFDTSKVTTMQNMFRRCKSLEKLDLRSFNTSNVTNMASMFFETYKLKPIFVGENWTTENATIDNMFGASATISVEELCEPGSIESWCVVN